MASDARFCVECGATVMAAPVAPTLTKVRTVEVGPIPPAPKKNGGRWLRPLLMAIVVVVALGLILKGLGDDGPSPSPISTPPAASSSTPTPIASSSPTLPPSAPSPSAQATRPSLSLQQALGEWTVDPKDPLYSRSESNALTLHGDGAQLRGVGPEDAHFRFWDQEQTIVGEATDGDGKVWKIGWVWLEPGVRARMSVTDGQEGHEVTLIRPSAAGAATMTPTPAKETPLFEARGDLNSDGSQETVRIRALVPGGQANSNCDKQIEILGADGEVVFQSDVFQAPFRTDHDDIAENPGQKSGVHILEKAEGYPVIRIIFVCRSGDFVDLQYDGKTYVPVVWGN